SAILRSVAEGSEVQRHQRLVVCVLRSIAERMKIKDALVHKLPRTAAMPAFEKFAQTLRSVLVAAPVQRFRDAVSKENQAVTRVEVASGALKFLVMEHANRQSWSADRVDSGSFHMKRSQMAAITDFHVAEFARSSDYQRGVLGRQGAVREDAVGAFH